MAGTLAEVANALVAHCKNHTELKGLDELYAQDAVSVEAMEMSPGAGRRMKGIDAIKGKHAWWNENMQVNSATVEGPYLHGDDRFAVTFAMDTTEKKTGKRQQMKEVGVYTVKDGKIVKEAFYYTM